MKKGIFIILFQLVLVFSVFPQSFIDKVSAQTYVPHGFVKLDSLVKNEILYKYHGDNKKHQYFVSSHNRSFIDTGIKIGSEFQTIERLGKLKQHRGWGYYLQLPSGWNAYLCLNKSEIDSSKVIFFFSTQKELYSQITSK
ncbi:hypothetical protein [Sphingobacterium bovistauri]|uniref:Uncharacterized protein n=1 Tax=Sphingobacterium bovistauri TaxID=2781959 RepID=A0ABS7Z8E0_9SPHI|nr:hypothetical protein [Sphingobacterium bovistauri]MCA5006466.1 hypothetical protein [Sphingobacterium bovistauri]